MADPKPPKDTSANEATPIPPVDRKSVESGLIGRHAVAESRRPETSVEESLNFSFDTIGSAFVRGGTTPVGNQLGSAIVGMYYFVSTITADIGENSQLLVVNGTNCSYLNSGGTYTVIRGGLTSGAQAQFTTMLNYVFMVNGVDPTAIWDGNNSGGFVTSGNASGAPVGTVIETFKQHVWIAGNPTYPDRVFYSSVPSAQVNPVVSWDANPTTGTQWFDVNPQDGDTITALQRFKTSMILFKTNHIYRIFDVGSADPDPYYSVGTSSPNSVVETKTGIFFHHSSGFYQYNVYGVVQEISGPIRIDFIRNIPESAYTSITGWLEPDQDHVCWQVGNVTTNGITYENLVLRYTISTMVWTHYSYPTKQVQSVRRQPLYTDGTQQYAVCGDNHGNVVKMNVGKLDTGSNGVQNVPIVYAMTHRWEMLDGLLSTRKVVQTINFSHYGGTGTVVAYQIEANDPSDLLNWSQRLNSTSFRNKNTGFNSLNIKGRKFRLRIFGQSAGEPFYYNGYEILGSTAEFIQFPN